MVLGHAEGPAAVCSQCLQAQCCLSDAITCQILLCTTQVVVCDLCIIWLLQQVWTTSRAFLEHLTGCSENSRLITLCCAGAEDVATI